MQVPLEATKAKNLLSVDICAGFLLMGISQRSDVAKDPSRSVYKFFSLA